MKIRVTFPGEGSLTIVSNFTQMKYLGLIPLLLFVSMVVQDRLQMRKFRQSIKDLEGINLGEIMTHAKSSSQNDF